jgi:hypothetical protein
LQGGGVGLPTGGTEPFLKLMEFGGASGSRFLDMDSFTRANMEKFAKSITLFPKKCKTIDFAQENGAFWKRMKGAESAKG